MKRLTLRMRSMQPRILIIAAFVIIGIIMLVVTKASVPTASIESEDGTKTGKYTVVADGSASGGSSIRFGALSANCGKTIQNYSYQVPFGNAVWNQPACDLPTHSQSVDYVKRLVEWGHINDGSPAANVNDGKIGTDPGFPKTPTLTDPDGLGTLFTTEVYYASSATTEKKVSSILYPSNLDGAKWNSNEALPQPGYVSQHPDTAIPFNPAWKTSRGGDNQMIILDDRPGSEGRIYSFWGYNVAGCASDAIFFPNRACGMSVQIARDYAGNIIDYRTFEGFTGDRGVGLSFYSTLTTADEVDAGEIRHALGISIPNTGYGPSCTSAQLAEPVNWDVVGKQCGTAVAPASKFEFEKNLTPPFMPEQFKPIYTQEKLIPEGMRFVLNMTYPQIEAWISSRADFASNPRRAETARIFARALKDYGMIVVDTNAGRPSVQTEGGINPDSAKKWVDLAMGPEYSDNLLDGLVNANNLRVVEPPLLTCDGGTASKFFCKWTNATYNN